ncbi:MAG TPA: metal-dependent hydrolase, partial [Thiotrichales bacterium]|nr:metal-dependent hydrolase [Thiotrichales bacterium]
MDPVSQAVLGASLSQSVSRNRQQIRHAFWIGALAGMAPDLDVFIRSAADPILFLEYHRQFSHSLFFIPFGALLCALVFYPFSRKALSFRQVYLYAFAGFATHGLLDACTSYGTQLFWPFSAQRVAWNTVAIVDPLFTLPVLLLVLLAFFRRKKSLARAAFVYALLYLSLGLVQKHRAEEALQALVAQRGQQAERIHVKPSFGNRHLWKLLYEYDGRYYVDAVRLLLKPVIIPGTSIPKLNVARDFPELAAGSVQANDIERFRWFSSDFLAVSPEDDRLVMDVRYSFLP